MNRILLFLIPLVGACMVFAFTEARGDINTASGKPMLVEDEILVEYAPSVTEESKNRIRTIHRMTLKQKSKKQDRFRVYRHKDPIMLLRRLRKEPGVISVEQNAYAYALMVPNDTYYNPYQWNMRRIGLEDAWNISTGSGVVIAVIDTGVRQSLSDLSNTNFTAGYDFVNNDPNPTDDEGHGSHVCGTLAQSTNNSRGVAGIAYNATIMPIKVLDSRARGTYSDIIDGIYYAVDNGADIINMSLGGTYNSSLLESAINYAWSHGVLVVCAAGNESSTTRLYPAAYSNSISVSATGGDDAITSYSSYGSTIDLSAPGGDYGDYNGDGYDDMILQNTFSWFNEGYYFYRGTSMASPHVAGVAALVKAADPSLTNIEIRNILESSAEDLGPVGWDQEYGWGLVDAYTALNWAEAPLINPLAVNITSPLDGETVSGTVIATADVRGEGIQFVEFFMDDMSIGEDFSAVGGWSSEWVTTSYSNGPHMLKARVTDSSQTVESEVVNVYVDNINDPPIAEAGPDHSVLVGETVTFDGSDSDDPDGEIVAYAWDFGDGVAIKGADRQRVTHAYGAQGIYTVVLTVTDDLGEAASDICIVNVSDIPDEVEVFYDSFESSGWNGLWTEDRQNDWFPSTQRATDGEHSAEVDGWARNAQLISVPIDLLGKTNVSVTFSWYIESGLDSGEYLAFDVSNNGGASWSEKAILRGNVDQENTWHAMSIELNDINSLRIRFRGWMNSYSEDANVDMIKVVAW